MQFRCDAICSSTTLLCPAFLFSYTILLRELKEELGTLQGKEVEVTHKKGDLEKQLEVSILQLSWGQHQC